MSTIKEVRGDIYSRKEADVATATKISAVELKELKVKKEKGTKALDIKGLVSDANEWFEAYHSRLKHLPVQFAKDMKRYIVNYFLRSADRFDKDSEKGLDKVEFRKYKQAMMVKMTVILTRRLPTKDLIEARKRQAEKIKKQVEKLKKTAMKEGADIFSTKKPTTPLEIQKETKKIAIRSVKLQKDASEGYKACERIRKAHEEYQSRNSISKRLSIRLRNSINLALKRDVKAAKKRIIEEVRDDKKKIEAHGKLLNDAGLTIRNKEIIQRDKVIAEVKKAYKGKDVKKKHNEKAYKELAKRKKKLLKYRKELIEARKDQMGQLAGSGRNAAVYVGSGTSDMFDAYEGALKQINLTLKSPHLPPRQRKALEAKKIKIIKYKKIADVESEKVAGLEASKTYKRIYRSHYFKAKVAHVDKFLEGTVNPSMKTLDASIRSIETAQMSHGDPIERITAKFAERIDILDNFNENTASATLEMNSLNSLTVNKVDQYMTASASLTASKPGWWGSTLGGALEATGQAVSYIFKDIIADKILGTAAKYIKKWTKGIPVLGTMGKVVGGWINTVGGIVSGAGELVSGLLQAGAKPVQTIKALTRLIGLDLDKGEWTTKTFGKAWLAVWHATYASEEFKKGQYGRGAGKVILNFFLAVVGAVKLQSTARKLKVSIPATIRKIKELGAKGSFKAAGAHTLEFLEKFARKQLTLSGGKKAGAKPPPPSVIAGGPKPPPIAKGHPPIGAKPKVAAAYVTQPKPTKAPSSSGFRTADLAMAKYKELFKEGSRVKIDVKGKKLDGEIISTKVDTKSKTVKVKTNDGVIHNVPIKDIINRNPGGPRGAGLFQPKGKPSVPKKPTTPSVFRPDDLAIAQYKRLKLKKGSKVLIELKGGKKVEGRILTDNVGVKSNYVRVKTKGGVIHKVPINKINNLNPGGPRGVGLFQPKGAKKRALEGEKIKDPVKEYDSLRFEKGDEVRIHVEGKVAPERGWLIDRKEIHKDFGPIVWMRNKKTGAVTWRPMIKIVKWNRRGPFMKRLPLKKLDRDFNNLKLKPRDPINVDIPGLRPKTGWKFHSVDKQGRVVIIHPKAGKRKLVSKKNIIKWNRKPTRITQPSPHPKRLPTPAAEKRFITDKYIKEVQVYKAKHGGTWEAAGAAIRKKWGDRVLGNTLRKHFPDGKYPKAGDLSALQGATPIVKRPKVKREPTKATVAGKPQKVAAQPKPTAAVKPRTPGGAPSTAKPKLSEGALRTAKGNRYVKKVEEYMRKEGLSWEKAQAKVKKTHRKLYDDAVRAFKGEAHLPRKLSSLQRNTPRSKPTLVEKRKGLVDTYERNVADLMKQNPKWSRKQAVEHFLDNSQSLCRRLSATQGLPSRVAAEVSAFIKVYKSKVDTALSRYKGAGYKGDRLLSYVYNTSGQAFDFLRRTGALPKEIVALMKAHPNAIQGLKGPKSHLAKGTKKARRATPPGEATGVKPKPGATAKRSAGTVAKTRPGAKERTAVKPVPKPAAKTGKRPKKTTSRPSIITRVKSKTATKGVSVMFKRPKSLAATGAKVAKKAAVVAKIAKKAPLVVAVLAGGKKAPEKAPGDAGAGKTAKSEAQKEEEKKRQMKMKKQMKKRNV